MDGRCDGASVTAERCRGVIREPRSHRRAVREPAGIRPSPDLEMAVSLAALRAAAGVCPAFARPLSWLLSRRWPRVEDQGSGWWGVGNSNLQPLACRPSPGRPARMWCTMTHGLASHHPGISSRAPRPTAHQGRTLLAPRVDESRSADLDRSGPPATDRRRLRSSDGEVGPSGREHAGAAELPTPMGTQHRSHDPKWGRRCRRVGTAVHATEPSTRSVPAMDNQPSGNSRDGKRSEQPLRRPLEYPRRSPAALHRSRNDRNLEAQPASSPRRAPQSPPEHDPASSVARRNRPSTPQAQRNPCATSHPLPRRPHGRAVVTGAVPTSRMVW